MSASKKFKCATNASSDRVKRGGNCRVNGGKHKGLKERDKTGLSRTPSFHPIGKRKKQTQKITKKKMKEKQL